MPTDPLGSVRSISFNHLSCPRKSVKAMTSRPFLSSAGSPANTIRTHPFSRSPPRNPRPAPTSTPAPRSLATASASSSHVRTPGASRAKTNTPAVAGTNSTPCAVKKCVTVRYASARRAAFSARRSGSRGERSSPLKATALSDDVCSLAAMTLPAANAWLACVTMQPWRKSAPRIH